MSDPYVSRFAYTHSTCGDLDPFCFIACSMVDRPKLQPLPGNPLPKPTKSSNTEWAPAKDMQEAKKLFRVIHSKPADHQLREVPEDARRLRRGEGARANLLRPNAGRGARPAVRGRLPRVGVHEETAVGA